MSALLYLIPGYSLYDLANTVSSDEPFPVKARSAALAGAVTGLHFLNATHHALKIQRLTGSAPAGLSHKWSSIRNISRSPKTPIALGIAAATVLISQIPGSSPDSYRYEERMAIADRLFNNPHY